MPYNQKHVWRVTVLNPTDNSVIQSSTHPTINDIYKTYGNINLSTWRNICMGRSKVYSKFIKVTKVLKTDLESNDNLENTDQEVETKANTENTDQEVKSAGYLEL